MAPELLFNSRAFLPSNTLHKRLLALKIDPDVSGSLNAVTVVTASREV